MTARRYTPPCRLRVKRRFLEGGVWFDPGEYLVWWGRDRWVIDPIRHSTRDGAERSMMAFRPQECPR